MSCGGVTRSRADRQQLEERGEIREEKAAFVCNAVVYSCMQVCFGEINIPASLSSDPQPLCVYACACVCVCVCVCFNAAVLPEQIIYHLSAVYSCFIKTSMVSCAADTSGVRLWRCWKSVCFRVRSISSTFTHPEWTWNKCALLAVLYILHYALDSECTCCWWYLKAHFTP